MSSNGANNSGNVSKETDDMNLQEERNKMAPFANLMDVFFSINGRVWLQTRDCYPVYNLDACGELYGEIKALKESILVLAYLFRRKFWELFQPMFGNEEDDVETCSLLFKMIPEDNYMFHYLVHLACLYEMITYRYAKGFDVDPDCKFSGKLWIDARFHNEGGFKELLTAASKINYFYDVLVRVFGRRYPNSDILTPFTRAVNIFERRFRYHEWLSQIEKLNITEDDPKHRQKLEALFAVDSLKYRLGYICVDKNKRSEDDDSISNISTQQKDTSIVDDSSFGVLDETDLKGNNEIPLSSTDKPMDISQTGAINNPEYLVFTYTTLLILSERFLEKHGRSLESEQKLNCKKDVKIFCPKTKTEVPIFPKQTLDANIRNCKSVEVIEGMRMFDIESFEEMENDLILDTSSEEEYELDSYQESIKRHAMEEFKQFSAFGMKKMKLLLNAYAGKGNLVKSLFEQTPKNRKSAEESIGATPIPIHRNPETGEESIGATQIPIQRNPETGEESNGATRTSIQRIPEISGESNGARPKLTTIQMKNGSNRQTNDQNAPVDSHSTNSQVSNLRKSSTRERRYTPDGKREWRKIPVKRT